MRIAENTWWVNNSVLTFHGFWRQKRNPGVVFMYIENSEMKTVRCHYASISAIIDDDWMSREELLDSEKERLLISRNSLEKNRD